MTEIDRFMTSLRKAAQTIPFRIERGALRANHPGHGCACPLSVLFAEEFGRNPMNSMWVSQGLKLGYSLEFIEQVTMSADGYVGEKGYNQDLRDEMERACGL